MNKYMIILIIAMSFICSALPSLTWSANDSIVVNQLSIRIEPVILVYNSDLVTYTTLAITPTLQTVFEENGEFSFNYNVPQLNMKISFKPFNNNYQVYTRIDYKMDTEIRFISIVLHTPTNTQLLIGSEAVMQQDASKNHPTTPFSNKIVQYSSGSNSFWVIGSHYDGTSGIERIENNQILLYDYHDHWAFFPRTETMHNWYPRKNGDSNDYTFLIAETKPFFPFINYYPAGKKAALCISNDADNESDSFLRAAYFGTSDSLSADYKQKGLATNHIRVTNTVFGEDLPTLKPIWNELLRYGNSIGYHTYSNFNDDISLLRQNLLYDMKPYNMKVWIDHGTNYENFDNYGTIPDSSSYSLDIILESSIKYVWMMRNQSESYINAYTEFNQLPHRVYAITDKPLYFFKRRMCSEWTMPDMPNNSFSVNVTAPHLDTLIAERGLFIVYTHFCLFRETAQVYNFLTYDPQTRIAALKPEANTCFEMMDDYQQNHGLWIDTTENVFDRILASDSLMIQNVLVTNDNIQFKISNTSSTSLSNVELTYFDQVQTIPVMEAGSEHILSFTKSDEDVTVNHYFLKNIRYSSKTMAKHKIFSFSLPIESELKSIAVYNIRGQKLDYVSPSMNYDKLDIDLSGKSSGIYFLKLEDKHSNQKLIKFTFIK